MKRLAIALAVLPGLIVAGGAKAESCTKSRDFILTNSTDLPQKPQVYRKLYQNCLDTLSLSNVEDAFVLTSGAIAVLPRHDTISATAGTLAQFCEHFPSGNLQFIPTRNRSQAANISLVVKMSSAHPTSCQQIKGGG